MHPDIPRHYIDQIITGDAKQLSAAIPDESIDLIFTDPVYDRVEDYEWLARESVRVLKPGGAALAFCGIGYLAATITALCSAGLSYRWMLTANYAMRKQFHGRLQVNTTICLWMEKGKSKMYGSVGDSTTLPHVREARYLQTNGASWDKHPKIVRLYLEGYCPARGVVLDPFTGGGTVPAACKQLDRHYIAFEIDPDTAEKARQRVANTQPPLFTLEPEQQQLL